MKSYGIYNTLSKKFVFGISEPSKKRASKALFNKIGKDSYKWRFEVREIKGVITDDGSRKVKCTK